jgi:hypothetical protein
LTIFPFSGDAEIIGSLSVTADTGNIDFYYGAPTGPNAWSAGGSLITARRCLAGAGEQNAALAFGGGNPGAVSCTEEYNGSSWTSCGTLITARQQLAGAGTQNAGLAFGGAGGQSCTEEYDGSTWASGGSLITARTALAGAGTQDAGLAFGGNYAVLRFECTEEYNGSTWASGGSLITARTALAGAGTQDAGLAFGGRSPSIVSCTEEYNGSTWSAGGALITARCVLAGAGTQNAGLAFGGRAPSTVSCTEEYNGSSWSAGGALSTSRYGLAGAGIQNDGLAFGGYGSYTTLSCTEEYSPGLVNTKTFEYNSTSGTTTVSCLIETSAQRYKDNIEPMGSQLSNVMRLQPVEFDWKMNKKHDIGFIAESVRDVYPNLISTNREGEVEGMNYTKLVSALVKSIQEQQDQINNLSEEINKLKNK